MAKRTYSASRTYHLNRILANTITLGNNYLYAKYRSEDTKGKGSRQFSYNSLPIKFMQLNHILVASLSCLKQFLLIYDEPNLPEIYVFV